MRSSSAGGAPPVNRSFTILAHRANRRGRDRFPAPKAPVMLVENAQKAAPGAGVTTAIRDAAQATGTSFDYLLATARVESGLDAGAGASTSSARGLFQFIEQTWLSTLKTVGSALGYGQYASA